MPGVDLQAARHGAGALGQILLAEERLGAVPGIEAVVDRIVVHDDVVREVALAIFGILAPTSRTMISMANVRFRRTPEISGLRNEHTRWTEDVSGRKSNMAPSVIVL
jgi:hypothetical protein